MNSLYIFQYWNDGKPYEAGGFVGKILGQVGSIGYGGVIFILKFIPTECVEGEACYEEKPTPVPVPIPDSDEFE